MSKGVPQSRGLLIGVVLGTAAVMLIAGLILGYRAGWVGEPSGSIVVGPGSASPLDATDGELPVLGEVPEFVLMGTDGSPWRRADLDGRPWAVEFIFTTCGGTCPKMSAEMARIQRGMSEDLEATLVSITVDPGHDTPEVLREYAARYDARPERWVFLTGEPQEIYRLAQEGFHLAAGPLPEEFDPEVHEGPFLHSRRVALVDGRGRVRGYYDGTDAIEMDRLARDLGQVH
jgi:protein SCO1/2